jgi:2-phospho-L-lactate guanylyltransferase
MLLYEPDSNTPELDQYMSNAVWAVIPVKNATDAKQRLTSVLSAHEREHLFRAMANDVFDALAAATSLAGVLVVTRDASLAADAARRGFECLEEPGNDGHTTAVERGIEWLVGKGVSTALALPADLPTLTGAEVDTLVAQRAQGPDLVVAPASDELGSNGMLMTPPDAVPLRFGEASFLPHLEAARARGIAPRVLHLAGFGLDIDHPEDLRRFVSQPRTSRAFQYLLGAGIVNRLERAKLGEPRPVI